jgi:hypothetical protein
MGGGRTYQVAAVGLDHGVEDGDGEPPPPPGGRGRGRRGAPGDELGLLLLVVSGGPPPLGGRGRALPDGRDVRQGRRRRGEKGGEGGGRGRKRGRGGAHPRRVVAADSTASGDGAARGRGGIWAGQLQSAGE